MTTIQQRLSEIFDLLQKAEQNLLLVLAVIYAPIPHVNLIQLLKITKFDSNVQNTVNRDFQERFQKMGFLNVSPDGWFCPREISDLLIKTAIERPWFSKLAQHIIMERENPYLSEKQIIFQKIKKLRLFLYQSNETGFEANMSLFYNEFKDHLEAVLKQLFFENFNKEEFIKFPEKIRFLVLKYALLSDPLSFDLTSMVNEHHIYNLLEEMWGNKKPQNEEIIDTIIEQRLLRGNDKNAHEWLNDGTSVNKLKLRATLAVLENHYDLALQLFTDALKVLRKGNKRTETLEGIYDFFYGLMLFRTRTLANLTILDAYLRIGIKKDNSPESFMILLHDTLEIYQRKKSFANSSLVDINVSQNPYLNLGRLLLCYWLDETSYFNLPRIQGSVLFPLNQHCQIANELGFFWYAAISSTLLQRFHYSNKMGDKIAKIYVLSPYLKLLEAIPRTTDWERALEALSQINTVNTSVYSEQVSSLRMAWTVEIETDGIKIEPREQRLGKGGAWSKGRVVSLKRLHSELETFHYLTEQDLKICKKIRKTSQPSDYYYYAEIYSIPEKSLLDMIGHPNVFWANQVQYHSPIDIQQSTLQLSVQEKGKDLHISLLPPISTLAKIFVQKMANGLMVYDINDSHRQVAQILGEKGMSFPLSARQQVLDSISSISSTLTVQSNMVGISTQAEIVTADNRLHLQLQPIGQGLQIEIFVQPFFGGGPLYKPNKGGTTVLAEIEGKTLQTTRDFRLEKNYVTKLVDSCSLLYDAPLLKWSFEEADVALEVLLTLQNIGDFVLLEWPKGKKIKLSREIGLSQTRFAIREKENWFSVEGELKIDDDQVLSMQHLMKLLANSTSRFLQLEDGQIIALTTELRQKLDDMRGVGEVINDKVQFHALAAQTLDEITDGMAIKASKSWKDQLKRLETIVDLNPQVPSTLQGELRDYQHEGFVWMSRLAHWGAGACLADDMGLGKTIQSLAFILSRAPNGATLILAPTSVCINWAEESAKFAPTLKVHIFGNGDRQAMLDNAGAFDLIICSYGLLQTEGVRLQQIKWHTLIADEAQAIKNAMTKRSKAAMALQADFKMVTTGTPIENHLGELWNLFNFINPNLLGSLARFNERYANPIENNHDHNAQQRLKKVLRPFVLRRLKNDVLTELPARTEVTLHIELSEEERAFYEALRREAMQVMAESQTQGGQPLQVLAEIMKLRRACCHPRLVMPESALSSSKLDAFEELVDELIDNRHKALVFSQFVGHLSLIKELLDKKGIIYHYLDGSTPTPQRKKAINDFQAGHGDLFLISLKAGGTGLNLTAADYVIHMDPWWNPAVEDQASDRAHRMGQKRPVTVYRLVTKDTIEDKIVALHHQKRDLANSLLEGGELGSKISMDDMLALLRDIEY